MSDPPNLIYDRKHIEFVLKILAILITLYLTNYGIWNRLEFLIFEEKSALKFFTFIFLWTISISVTLVAAFHPNVTIRNCWAFVFALSTSVAITYRHVTDSDLTPPEVLSLWYVRHEAERAMQAYPTASAVGTLTFVITWLVVAWPTTLNFSWRRRTLRFWAFLPTIPIIIMSAFLFSGIGQRLTAFPQQFSQIANFIFTGFKIATTVLPSRSEVRMLAGNSLSERIIMLVDESIRSDYISLDPGNKMTPGLAENRERFVDFGPAASGSNCSASSNAILRFAAARHDLSESIRLSPTLWRYAKKAGYRTVYIDGQSAHIKALGSVGGRNKLQNHMTILELRDIDKLYVFENTPDSEADQMIADIIADELDKPGKTFIYANKNGAHFPYKNSYPADKFKPFEYDEYKHQDELLYNYRNAVTWSVDYFFKRLLYRSDLQNSVLFYTSDHGQRLQAGKASHCTVVDPDPREALVPLLVAASAPDMHRRFQQGAQMNFARADHFSITPSILLLMGYSPVELEQNYHYSLFTPIQVAPYFTSGDVMGIFEGVTHWNSIDLTLNYHELGDSQMVARADGSLNRDGSSR